MSPKTNSKWKEFTNHGIFFWCFVYLVLYVEGGSEKNLWNNKSRNNNWTVRIKKPEETKDAIASLRIIKEPQKPLYQN